MITFKVMTDVTPGAFGRQYHKVYMNTHEIGEIVPGCGHYSNQWIFSHHDRESDLSAEELQEITNKVKELNQTRWGDHSPDTMTTKKCTCIRIGLDLMGRPHYWPFWQEDEDYGDEELNPAVALQMMSDPKMGIEVAWLNPADNSNWELGDSRYPFKG